MAYCSRCRQPGVPAVAIYTADGPQGRRSGGACPRHQETVRAWVANVGHVHETTVRAPPADTREPDHEPQQALF